MRSLFLTIVATMTASMLFGQGSTTFESREGDLFLADGSTFIDGGVAVLGQFSDTFDPTAADFTFADVVGTDFTQLATADITVSGGFAQFSGSYTTNDGAIAGEQLHVWLFNTADPLTATENALMTGSEFVGSGSAVTDAIAFDVVTDFDSLIYGIFDNSGTFPSVSLVEVVPEPSTYVLIGLGLTMVGVFVYRRRQS